MCTSRLFLLLAGLSAGCAANAPATRSPGTETRPAPTAPPAASQGLTPREALAREVSAPLQRQPVAAEGVPVPFQGEVLTAGTPEVVKRPNGVTIVSLPIGTAEPVICLFYPAPIDAGAAARSLFESLLDDVTLERVRATEVRALAGSPALYLEGDFTRGTAPAVQVGRLKLMVHADPVLPKACFHDELGYAQTFLRVTESIATGLVSTSEKQPVPPYFSDIQVMRVGNQVLGFQYTALFSSKGGGTLLEASTTLVRPGSPAELQFQDTSLMELADTQGVLVSKRYAKRVNQAVTASVSLSRAEDGGYGVEGQVAGKDVQAKLSGGLLGEVGLASRLREGPPKSGGEAIEAAMWVPSANLTTPTRVEVRPRTGAGPRAATMVMGPLALDVELDTYGFVERMEVPVGGATMVQERLSRTGEP
ncbi:MAG: hypothetical protein JXB05_32825 [Myxococcaceae bacterium]|nr:hypothetical protein [Myxococcaceae bacterium]